MKNYDTVIILSHGPSIDNKEIFGETKRRIDRGVSLYLEGFAQTITLLGGRTNKNFSYTEAGMMYLYVSKNGVDKRDIYKEEKSLDTVGQAIFSKLEIIVPQNWKRLIVVSSDYHMPRVKKIFNFVYGKGFDIKYINTKSELKDNQEVKEKELTSLRAFHRTFKGIESGNSAEILRGLFEKHPLYKAIGGI